MEITTKSFQKGVLESKIPVLLECWASWCLPCKQIDPTLKQLSEKYRGRCKVLKINIDKNPDIAKKFNIRGLPSFFTFYNGKQFERKVGSLSDDELDEMINKALEYYTNSNRE